MPSSIATVNAVGVNLANQKLKPVAAGLALSLYYANGVQVNPAKVVAYLYGPDRRTPETASLKKAELPANLPVGDYALKARVSPEKDYMAIAFSVAAPVEASEPVPLPPAEEADTGTPPVVEPEPSHLIKGVVTDVLIPPETPVVRLDGSTVTMADMHRAWNTQAARVWCSVDPYGLPVRSTVDKWVTWCVASGIRTLIIVCTPKDGGKITPMAANVTKWFKALLPMIRARGIRIIIELVNEPNLASYWRPLSLPLLIKCFVSPAEQVLSAAGFEVIGPSAAGSVQTVKNLIAGGLACDAYGFHPYCDAVTKLKNMLGDLIKTTGGSPVDLTEFNVGLGDLFAAGLINAADITQVQIDQWGVLLTKPSVRFVCYYILIATKATPNSSLALLAKDAAGVIRETEFSRDFWAKVA